MMELDTELGARLALSLGLGLLVGVQRERVHGRVAGVRTFGVAGALGGFAGALHPWGGAALLSTFAVATLALVVVGQWLERAEGDRDPSRAPDPGQTSEFAALLTYAIGAFAVLGDMLLAAMAGGALMVLLESKRLVHAMIRGLGERDFRGIVQLVLIALVAFPLVPDLAFGPEDVIELRNVALMIVLVSALSLAGYFAYRTFGGGRGLLLAGLLGGGVSSTATTVGASRNARSGALDARAAAVMVMLAGCVVWVRVLVEVAAVSPSHLADIGAPLAGLAAGTVAVALWFWWRARDSEASPVEQRNPAQLGAAVAFGLLYALVLVLVAWVEENLADSWLYLAALLSGLTDMDAITLSTARLAEVGKLAPSEAWRLMAVAFLGNLAFKTLLAGVIGGLGLLRALALPTAMTAAIVLLGVLVGALG